MTKLKKNKIIFKDDYVGILLNHKTYGRAIAKIDVEDLPKVENIKWGLLVNKKTYTIYVVNNHKGVITYLHRIITNCPDDLIVSHINHDTLDNRKQNLKLKEVSNNFYFSRRSA